MIYSLKVCGPDWTVLGSQKPPPGGVRALPRALPSAQGHTQECVPTTRAKHSGLVLAGVPLWDSDYWQCYVPVFLCESERLDLWVLVVLSLSLSVSVTFLCLCYSNFFLFFSWWVSACAYVCICSFMCLCYCVQTSVSVFVTRCAWICPLIPVSVNLGGGCLHVTLSTYVPIPH